MPYVYKDMFYFRKIRFYLVNFAVTCDGVALTVNLLFAQGDVSEGEVLSLVPLLAPPASPSVAWSHPSMAVGALLGIVAIGVLCSIADQRLGPEHCPSDESSHTVV